MPAKCETAVKPLTARQRRRVERYAAQWNPGAVVRARFPGLYRAALAAGLDHEDVDAEAWVGVVRAAQTFDPGRGVKFVTHAHWWVRGAVSHAVRRANRAYEAGVVLVRGDATSGAGMGRRRRLWDSIPDRRPSPAPADALECVAKLLTERDRRLLELRVEGRTFEEIAVEFGVTRQRAKQLWGRVAERVRVPLMLAVRRGA